MTERCSGKSRSFNKSTKKLQMILNKKAETVQSCLCFMNDESGPLIRYLIAKFEIRVSATQRYQICSVFIYKNVSFVDCFRLFLHKRLTDRVNAVKRLRVHTYLWETVSAQSKTTRKHFVFKYRKGVKRRVSTVYFYITMYRQYVHSGSDLQIRNWLASGESILLLPSSASDIHNGS